MDYLLFRNEQGSSDNLIGQSVIAWGCVNGWLSKSEQCVCDSCFVRRAVRISTNQSDEDWHHAPDSCTLEVFCAPPKREFAHFYLGSLNNFLFFVVDILKIEIHTGTRE